MDGYAVGLGYLGSGILGLGDGPQLRHLLPLRRVASIAMAVLALISTEVHSCCNGGARSALLWSVLAGRGLAGSYSRRRLGMSWVAAACLSELKLHVTSKS